ncbi:Outer membrane receptor proteins, mostly Fe transport [Catalinimonas alkaloidigena]|uniref:Outer membrane receptor proteins, mostly Fe transport n=1 Tax=Catalinimonas alkaloidigena TaxID=1075417 RepID=A0A1G9T9V2_9BACT|nr:TonB-dependent receptor [Catalinimonas alkaloidigena]SDM44426.1 Outer membrane receptor proteins, mostly Fe transport [Catalinimonas alkaloidigena]
MYATPTVRPVRMPFSVLFSLLLLLLPLVVQAQSGGKGRVTGKVVDAETKAPLPYATVSLFAPHDSSLVAGGITDDAGTFALEASQGTYYATINFLGYPVRTLPTVTVGATELNLGTLTLKAATIDLDEVVVQGEKDVVELSLDKKVFNVSADPINAGRTAADILGNLPSVTVDGEGGVRLRGSSNVQILVDGKPSGMVSFDGAEGLRTLQGSLVERVEIITNPSARYQAEGMAGIINIVLKKERQQGFNGSFDFTVGHPANYGAAINLNYRRERFNFFVNYGLYYRNITNPRNQQYQEVYDADTTFLTQQYTTTRQRMVSNNIQFGADYFLNPQNIFTTSFTYRHSKGTRGTSVEYFDYLNTKANLNDITRRAQHEDEVEPILEYALNYKRTFNRKDQELTAVLSYMDHWEDSDQLYTTRLFDPNNSLEGEQLQKSLNYETEKQILIQADYVQPYSENGKLEAGMRNTLRDLTNDYLVTQQEGEQWVPLPGLDNEFLYDENIYAAYLINSNKVARFGYQLGLRAEYTDVTTTLIETNDVNPRSYLNFFPSAHITYEMPKENALQLSYSRRLHRPTYNDLTPFVTFFDNRNYFSGNPDLNPEYTHAFEAGHLKYFDQASLSSAVYYRHTNAKIQRIRTVNEAGIATTAPYNLLTEDAYGAEFIASYRPTNWWKLDGTFNFYRSIIDGTNVRETYQSDTYTWFTRVTSRLTLWGTDMQLRGNYTAPQQTPQGRQLSTAYLDMAITRDVLHNRGTLTLNISDVFNSNRSRSIVEGDIFYTNGSFQQRPRQINLTLNYRINQQKKQKKDLLEESGS